MQAPISPETVLRNYFHAKDENRPLLLDQVFTEHAFLDVRGNGAAVGFPTRTLGREALADVLVRTFGQTYENIYSFYLARPVGDLASFKCGWFVVMTEKTSRNVRCGCGHYEWTFSSQHPKLAQGLVIHIAAMLTLDASATEAAYGLVARLTYPWSTGAAVSVAAEGLAEIAPVLQALSAQERDA